MVPTVPEAEGKQYTELHLGEDCSPDMFMGG